MKQLISTARGLSTYSLSTEMPLGRHGFIFDAYYTEFVDYVVDKKWTFCWAQRQLDSFGSKTDFHVRFTTYHPHVSLLQCEVTISKKGQKFRLVTRKRRCLTN